MRERWSYTEAEMGGRPRLDQTLRKERERRVAVSGTGHDTTQTGARVRDMLIM